jgi:hypothetical protein
MDHWGGWTRWGGQVKEPKNSIRQDWSDFACRRSFFEEQLKWRIYCRKLTPLVETSVDNCCGGNGSSDNDLVHVLAGSAYTPAVLFPVKGASGTHCIGGLVRLRAGLDAEEKMKESVSSSGNWIPILQSSSSWSDCYTEISRLQIRKYVM